MHILIVPSWYKTTENPIRGSFFRDQAQALYKAGHQVGMLVPPSKLRSFHGLAEVRRNWRQHNTDISIESDVGVMIYRIPWWGWQESVLIRRRGDLALRIFDRYCEDVGRPDVLHGHSTLYGGYLAAYIGEQRGIPVILTEHSTNYQDGYILPGQAAIIRYTLQHTARRFAVGAGLAEALRTYEPGQDVDVIGNIVDVNWFTPPTVQPPDSPFVFLMVASLSRRKGHEVLLPAFAQVQQGRDVQLNIVGSGYTGRRLERLNNMIEQLGLQNLVKVYGLVTKEQLLQQYQKAHVLVSSSYTEGFGVTLIEAMACGKPVVATRSGGPEYFVNENSGLLVPIRRVDALAAAMGEMFDNYDRYDSAQIRAECVARFSEEAIVSRLEAEYCKVTTAFSDRQTDNG